MKYNCFPYNGFVHSVFEFMYLFLNLFNILSLKLNFLKVCCVPILVWLWVWKKIHNRIYANNAIRKKMRAYIKMFNMIAVCAFF